MYIKVNHSKLKDTASAVEKNIAIYEETMTSATNEVNALGADWQGSDYQQYANQWDKLDDSDSLQQFLRKTMQDYADYLKYCAAQYAQTQADAINRAKAL